VIAAQIGSHGLSEDPQGTNKYARPAANNETCRTLVDVLALLFKEPRTRDDHVSRTAIT
jgi:hypothetical protein